MPTLTVSLTYSTEAERLALEQAIAYLTHLHQVAAEAPAGTVLDACEQLALGEGRAVLRTTLEAALQSRIRATDAAPKKSPASAPKAPARGGSSRPSVASD
jgi:hypothetical protein